MSLTIEEVELGQLPSGDPLTSRCFRFERGRGKNVWIQANVHGGELQGNLVVLELLEQLAESNINGTISLMPMVNPLGLAQAATMSGVYDAMTGLNFNRQYQRPTRHFGEPEDWRLDVDQFAKDHAMLSDEEIVIGYKAALREAWERYRKVAQTTEQRFVAELQSRSFDADLYLDLHTGDRSPRYLFAFDSTVESARYLNSPHNLLMDDSRFEGAGDEAHFNPWYTLQQALAHNERHLPIPVESFTVELGSLDVLDESSARRSANDIMNYLRHHGVVDGDASPREMRRYACRHRDYIAVQSPAGGLTAWQKEPGEHVRVGEVVAELISFRAIEDLETISRARTLITAPADGIVINQHHRAMVSRGTTIFKLMTNVSELPG